MHYNRPDFRKQKIKSIFKQSGKESELRSDKSGVWRKYSDLPVLRRYELTANLNAESIQGFKGLHTKPVKPSQRGSI
jgi:hypothetical protein